MSYLYWPQFGRFAGPAQLILFSLIESPKSGRELQNELEQSYENSLELSMLYGALRRLESQGWIAPLSNEQAARSYCLTERGMAIIAQRHASQAERSDRIGLHQPHRCQKEHMMSVIIWILRLYPPAWRERYEQEMRMLLEEHQITIFTWLDLGLGALDARLDPHYRITHRLSPLQRFQRMRTASIIAFCAFPLSIFFYFVFIIDQVDGPWDKLRDAQQPIVALASTLGTIATLIWGATFLAAILLLAYHSFRKSTTPKKEWLGLLPMFSMLVAGGAIASHFLFPSWPWLNNLQFALFWLGTLSVPASIALAIAKGKIGESTLRIFLLLSTLMSVGMALYQFSLIIDQGVTSFLWPGGNWSLQLIMGLLLMMTPTLVALWLLTQNWMALPPSRPSAPTAEMLPLQSQS